MNSVIQKSDGVTPAERYLKRLCDRTFLSLWSYPGIYRDRGKEVCDLLVVFENHIIIFSDKDCAFPNTGDIDLDWSRWFRNAIVKSAEQIWGAERWIRKYPDRLFLDKKCKQPFPIPLPDPSGAQFHRILVAHGVSHRCREELGGSGSLMLDSTLVGSKHTSERKAGGIPFTIGHIDPAKGYIHVLDDTSLNILLTTLDTITDFVSYLSKKERIMCNSEQHIFAAGEEELLAVYHRKLNKEGQHDFLFDPNLQAITITEGHWQEFIHSRERKAQVKADKISYFWDALIENFSTSFFSNNQNPSAHLTLTEHEKIMRFLARESRTRRRLLAKSFLSLIEKTPKSCRATRVMLSTNPKEPYYVFLLLPKLDSVEYEEYRAVRGQHLYDCCTIAKIEYPDALEIVGLATEAGIEYSSSFDAVYLDARNWTADDIAEGESVQQQLSVIRGGKKEAFAGSENEFPIDKMQKSRRIGRNELCPCGSGKKYKKCHGR